MGDQPDQSNRPQGRADTVDDRPVAPAASSPWRRALLPPWRGLRIAAASVMRLARLDIVTRSSHLAYLTIFGSVPLLVLSVAVMQPLGLLADAQQDIHEFLATAGLTRISINVQTEATATSPAQPVAVNLADQIQKLINTVMSRITVGRVGPIGIIVLAWAAISLVSTLEKTLNLIFDARRNRPLTHRLLLYWSVVTLVPLCIVAVSLPAERAIEQIGSYGWVSWAVGGFAYVAPTLAGILIVAGIYAFLPNTYVPVGAGLVGAIVAVPIWVIAKKSFGFYLKHVMVSGSLYGAIGLVPVALVYVNMSWLILLWGAQLAKATCHGGRVRTEQVWELATQPTDLLAAALLIARYFHAGLGPVPFYEIVRQVNLPDEQVRTILDYLQHRDIAYQVDDRQGGRFALARPAEKISLLEVVDLHARHGMEVLENRYDKRTALTIFRMQDQAQTLAGDLTLADALKQEKD